MSFLCRMDNIRVCYRSARKRRSAALCERKTDIERILRALLLLRERRILCARRGDVDFTARRILNYAEFAVNPLRRIVL